MRNLLARLKTKVAEGLINLLKILRQMHVTLLGFFSRVVILVRKNVVQMALNRILINGVHCNHRGVGTY